MYEVKYYPNKGFAFKYYPYYNQPNYLPPIVFVQFDTPKEGTLIQVSKHFFLKFVKYCFGSVHTTRVLGP